MLADSGRWTYLLNLSAERTLPIWDFEPYLASQCPLLTACPLQPNLYISLMCFDQCWTVLTPPKAFQFAKVASCAFWQPCQRSFFITVPADSFQTKSTQNTGCMGFTKCTEPSTFPESLNWQAFGVIVWVRKVPYISLCKIRPTLNVTLVSVLRKFPKFPHRFRTQNMPQYLS